MLKKITDTFFTRIFSAGINFLMIVLTARMLGAEARGVISLCFLAISIIALINEIVGGPAMVYLVPRYNNKKLIIYSYLWSFIVCISCSYLLSYFNYYPPIYLYYIMLGSTLLSIGNVHQFILLGHEKIKQYNISSMIQSAVLIGSFLFLITINFADVKFYLLALIIAYFINYLLGIYFTIFSWQSVKINTQFSVIRTIFKNGLLTQLASIAHILSTRVVYYFLNQKAQIAALGVLSVAISLSEAALLFSGSIAVVAYATLVNQNDNQKSAELILKLTQLSIAIAIVISVLILFTPSFVFEYIFGKEFKAIKTILLTLIPSILAYSISSIINNYFSGIGKYYVNTVVGFATLFVTLVLSFTLLKTDTVLMPGAIISLSAIVGAIIYCIYFFKETPYRIFNLFPKTSVVNNYYKTWKRK
jgi:O-antigen/teichoic acid export membrane protein